MAATFSIAAVFIPVAYMKGMIGQFLFEFGISVAAAVLISLFVALTLTPMLCSRILKVQTKTRPALRGHLRRGFEGLENASYSRALDWVLHGTRSSPCCRPSLILFVASLALVAASSAPSLPRARTCPRS